MLGGGKSGLRGSSQRAGVPPEDDEGVDVGVDHDKGNLEGERRWGERSWGEMR